MSSMVLFFVCSAFLFVFVLLGGLWFFQGTVPDDICRLSGRESDEEIKVLEIQADFF